MVLLSRLRRVVLGAGRTLLVGCAIVACTGEDSPPAAPPTAQNEGGVSSSSSGSSGGPVCQPRAKGCVGAVPRTCDENGTWHDEAACTGIAPICTDGACVAFRVHGGIDTLGVPPTAAGTLRIRDNGLQEGKRSCGDALCVTGGIAP